MFQPAGASSYAQYNNRERGRGRGRGRANVVRTFNEGFIVLHPFQIGK